MRPTKRLCSHAATLTRIWAQRQSLLPCAASRTCSAALWLRALLRHNGPAPDDPERQQGPAHQSLRGW